MIQEFAYDDIWYDATDGGGSSLVILDVSGDVATWNDVASWRPSVRVGGSPGETDLLASDVNRDGSVGLVDLAIVQSGPGTVSRVGVTALLRDLGRSYAVPLAGPEAGGSPVADTSVAAPAAITQPVGNTLLQRRTTIRTTRRGRQPRRPNDKFVSVTQRGHRRGAISLPS